MANYTNPVYSDYFADPFVWQHQGIYYAIGTGRTEAVGQVDEIAQRRVFPLLWSNDLVNWQFAGNALQRPDLALGDNFWAPEVAYCDGMFYLYYSVGHEDKNHQLRVATSSKPLGPYLDFLDTENGVRAGTALVVDRLITMTKLAGETRVVLRARHDWQRFLADRPMYGKIYDWHTLEGPCVRKHHNRYYCFYSGGRWDSENYGVDYGVADHVMGPYSDVGSESGARVLRTVPDVVLGPGHNSIALSPNGQSEYVVYHAWDAKMEARRMCIDLLIWTPEGPRCQGPTWTSQII